MGLMSRGLWRCSVAAVLFGASAPAASRLAGDLSPFALAGLLYLGAGLAVLPVVAMSPPRRSAVRASAGALSVAIVAGGALAPVLLAVGLARTPAATASLLLNLELVATVILAAFVFHEYLGGRVIVGTLLVASAGVALIWSSTPSLRIGAVAVVCACILWAVDNAVTANLDQIAPSHITFAKGAIAGTANVIIGLLVGSTLSASQVLAGLATGALGYGLSITLWIKGARDLGAARAQLIFATAPFVGAIVAWTLLGESVHANQVVAIAVAAAGVACVAGSDHLHQHLHTPLDHEHEHRHPDDPHHTHRHPDDVIGAHAHRHSHDELVHAHAHVPDLHHRHPHDH